MNYWSNKKANAQKAKEHIALMETFYTDQIDYSIKNSRIYSSDFIPSMPNTMKQYYSQHFMLPSDTLHAIFTAKQNFPNDRICVMNFASYKNPGGKFLEGSSAQEESLCHSSTLYNVLSKFPSYYDENKRNLNRALYTNRAIYTPNIMFEMENEIGKFTTFVDVLTCAAPNTGAYTKYNKVDKDPIDAALMDREFIIDSVLMSRISFIKDILVENQVDVFIYGAFGCGVFKNDPKRVAEISKGLFDLTNMTVIYAIPMEQNYFGQGQSNKNYDAFEKVINK